MAKRARGVQRGGRQKAVLARASGVLLAGASVLSVAVAGASGPGVAVAGASVLRAPMAAASGASAPVPGEGGQRGSEAAVSSPAAQPALPPEADIVEVGGRAYHRVEVRANTFTFSEQGAPGVGLAPDGRFIVVWHSRRQEAGNYGVYGQVFSAIGHRIGGEEQMNLYGHAYQRLPGVAMAGDGSGWLVWESFGQDGDDAGVVGRRLGSDLRAGRHEIPVNQRFEGPQAQAAVACDAAGNAVFVWITPVAGEGLRVVGRRFRADTSPAGHEFAVSPDAPAGNDSHPDVACAPDGSFAVVLARVEENGSAVWLRRFSAAGEPVGQPVRVSDAHEQAVDPHVAADAEGRWVVTWETLDAQTGRPRLRARVCGTDGAPLAGTVGIEAPGWRVRGGHAVSAAGKGRFIVVFSARESAGHDAGDVVGCVYEYAGRPAGEPFRVNRHREGMQRIASGGPQRAVAYGPQGQIVVAWEGNGGLGDPNGAYATLLIPVYAEAESRGERP